MEPANAADGFTWDVLGLGCVAVDDLLYIPAYPPPDSKVRVRRRERQGGGLTGTALVAASRLGARCAFAGVLGDDDDSRYLEEAFRREGVDTSPVVRRTGRGRSARPSSWTKVSTPAPSSSTWPARPGPTQRRRRPR